MSQNTPTQEELQYQAILEVQNDNIISMNKTAVTLYEELVNMEVDSREKYEYYITNMGFCQILELQTVVNQHEVKRNTTMRDTLYKRLNKNKDWRKFQI